MKSPSACLALFFFSLVVAFVSVVSLGSLLSGCALFGSSDTVTRSERYHVKAPEGWVKHEEGESDHAYRLVSGSFVTLTSSCERHSRVSLELLTKQALIGARQIRIERQKRRVVDQTPGLQSSLTAVLEGKKFFMELFVISKGGCVFDFSLISASPLLEEDKRAFVDYIRSFHYGTINPT